MRRNRRSSSREHVLRIHQAACLCNEVASFLRSPFSLSFSAPREVAPIHSKPGELREFHPKSLHKTFPICRPPVAVSPLTYEHFCDRKRWLEAHVPLTSANGHETDLPSSTANV